MEFNACDEGIDKQQWSIRWFLQKGRYFQISLHWHLWMNFKNSSHSTCGIIAHVIQTGLNVSRFWEAYYSETINFRENKYQTKSVYFHHKSFVLKFGNDESNGDFGRPYFVRITLFQFFVCFLADLRENLNFWKRFRVKNPENPPNWMYFYPNFLFKKSINLNF